MFNNDYYFIALFRYKSLKPLKFLDTIFFIFSHQEMLKDLFYGVGYKKDYFIKGKTKLEPLQAEKELLKLSFIYVSKEISYKWKAMGKTFTMHQHVYEPIFEAFKDHSIVSTKEIQDILQAKYSSDRFNQAIIEENQYAYYLNHLVSPISAKGIYLNKKRASRF